MNDQGAFDVAPGPLLRIVRDQRVAFIVVGGINTLVGYLFFLLFDFTIGRGLIPRIGAPLAADVVLACSHVCSVLVAFVLHRRFVFRVRGHVVRDLLRFESVYLVAIGINALVLPLVVATTHWPAFVAQLPVIVVTTMLSYFGHREFSFRRSEH